MTESLSPCPSRRDSVRGLLWHLDTTAGVVAMFALAFLVRVSIAPHVGFYGDLFWFRTWTARLAEVGPHDFYHTRQFIDYPPGYLYVLWLIGKYSAAPSYLLLKAPAILADLGLAWISGTFAARIAPASIKAHWPVRAVVAAAVLFNPAIIALSAAWGQVDALPAVFVLWSLLLLLTGPQSLRREIAAFVLFAVAIAMKAQSGFVLPVMLYALYRRYLRGRDRSGVVKGAASITALSAVSLGLWCVSGLPFDLGPAKLFRLYMHSASVYSVTSANAFNLWGFVGFWRQDSSFTVAGIPALYAGMLLLAAGVVLVLWRAAGNIGRGGDEARVLTVAAAVVSLLAYTLLTRMHERYMFYSLAYLAPLLFVRPLRFVYAGLSGLFILNLWFVYGRLNGGWVAGGSCTLRGAACSGFGWIFGDSWPDTWQKRGWSLAVTAIAMAIAWFGVRWAAQSKPRRMNGHILTPSGTSSPGAPSSAD